MVIQNITNNNNFAYLCTKISDNTVTMAMKIKSVPVLSGTLAIKFIAKADTNASKIANTKDYTEQVNKSLRILDRAKSLK